MRIGFNPNKDLLLPKSEYTHQVIIPVHIPNQEGYFKNSFQILKISLDSLFITCHSKTYITVVNNGSCDEVISYLNNLYKDKKIQELTHVDGIGKLNAVLKGLVGQNFDLITISDADVFFLENWQKATYSVFEFFSKAGAVCTTPSSRSLRTHTANIYWDFFFSNKLSFTNVVNPVALRYFAKSIGNEAFYNESQLEHYLTIENNGNKAVIGAGHFVCTYRKEVFQNLPKFSSAYSLGGDSEGYLLDRPVSYKGLWRLSTTDNFTYHMGNVHENWMDEEVSKLKVSEKEVVFRLSLIKLESKLSYFIKSKVFGKFILNKKILRNYLVWKGLPRDNAKNYLS